MNPLFYGSPKDNFKTANEAIYIAQNLRTKLETLFLQILDTKNCDTSQKKKQHFGRQVPVFWQFLLRIPAKCSKIRTQAAVKSQFFFKFYNLFIQFASSI
jgi:hypothetical protein